MRPQTQSKFFTKIVTFVGLTFFLFTIIITLYHPYFEKKISEINYYNNNNNIEDYCDLSLGEWVQNREGPNYYTNMSCNATYEYQNCMKYGRPDTDFFKWKQKPDGCELPIFDAHQFLEIVRGKSMAFVGDSVARNHMQSLICLLSKVLYSYFFNYYIPFVTNYLSCFSVFLFYTPLKKISSILVMCHSFSQLG